MARELSIEELQGVLGENAELLGEGVSSTVYKGFVNGTPVAVKKLKPDSTRLLEKELEVLLGLSHGHIVRLDAFCRADHALVYEYLPGGNLQQRIESAKANPIPWSDKLRMAFEMSLGLHFLHSRDIIHRDIKPPNVLLDARGRCRIGDFGFAREVDGSSYLVTGAGTRGYLAPEIFTAEGMTKRSDVYSLGWTLLSLFTCIPSVAKLWGECQIDLFFRNQSKWEKGLQTQGLFGWKSQPGPLLLRVLECLDPDSGAWDPAVVQPVVECALRCVSHDPRSRPGMLEVSSVMEKAWKAQKKLAKVPSSKTRKGSNTAKGARSSSKKPSLKSHSSGAAPRESTAPQSTEAESSASQLGSSPMNSDEAQFSSGSGASDATWAASTAPQSTTTESSASQLGRSPINSDEAHFSSGSGASDATRAASTAPQSTTTESSVSQPGRSPINSDEAQFSSGSGASDATQAVSIAPQSTTTGSSASQLARSPVNSDGAQFSSASGASDAIRASCTAMQSTTTGSKASQLGRIPWRSPMFSDEAQSFYSSGTSWDAEEFYIPDIPKAADDRAGVPLAKRVMLRDLERATKDFSTKLGGDIGVFGTTQQFKGTADSTFLGRTGSIRLVVHKLEGSLVGCQEIVLKALRLRHPHLDRLVAYSAEKGGVCLAFKDRRSSVTLERALFGERNGDVLSWEQRVKVALGAAKGLAHLHSEKVIHGDFTPSNILLNHEYNAVVTGVKGGFISPSRLRIDVDLHNGCTELVGGAPYRDIGWFWAPTVASAFSTDTCSFGIVLLELLSGRKNRKRGELVQWAMAPMRGDGKPKIQKMMDPRLQETYSKPDATKLAILAKRCIGDDPGSRPEMTEVVHHLEMLLMPEREKPRRLSTFSLKLH